MHNSVGTWTKTHIVQVTWCTNIGVLFRILLFSPKKWRKLLAFCSDIYFDFLYPASDTNFGRFMNSTGTLFSGRLILPDLDNSLEVNNVFYLWLVRLFWSTARLPLLTTRFSIFLIFLGIFISSVYWSITGYLESILHFYYFLCSRIVTSFSLSRFSYFIYCVNFIFVVYFIFMSRIILFFYSS